MIKRLQNIIEREKIQKPGTSPTLLLLKGLYHGIERRYQTWRMNVQKDSTFKSEKDLFMCSLFPKKVLDIILLEINPKTVLDVGCGTGKSLEYFLTKGIHAIGIENSLVAIENSKVKDRIVRHNLNKELELNTLFDLVWCFEVIEHIHPDFESSFLRTLTNHSNLIVISAAKPGQGGHGHFNEQLPEYWISKFNSLGYEYDKSFSEKLKSTAELHTENLLCFRKVC